jgi:hypothetical protein
MLKHSYTGQHSVQYKESFYLKQVKVRVKL